jgi:hypothetical protein
MDFLGRTLWLLISVAVTTSAIGQKAASSGSSPATMPTYPVTVAVGDDAASARHASPSMSAAQRQQQLSDEMNKLFDLTQALKAETEQLGPDNLPVDAVKKAQEIQRLAKRVERTLKAQ